MKRKAKEKENKTKDVQGQGPSNINQSLFVCFFDVYWSSEPCASILIERHKTMCIRFD